MKSSSGDRASLAMAAARFCNLRRKTGVIITSISAARWRIVPIGKRCAPTYESATKCCLDVGLASACREAAYARESREEARLSSPKSMRKRKAALPICIQYDSITAALREACYIERGKCRENRICIMAKRHGGCKCRRVCLSGGENTRCALESDGPCNKPSVLTMAYGDASSETRVASACRNVWRRRAAGVLMYHELVLAYAMSREGFIVCVIGGASNAASRNRYLVASQ